MKLSTTLNFGCAFSWPRGLRVFLSFPVAEWRGEDHNTQNTQTRRPWDWQNPLEPIDIVDKNREYFWIVDPPRGHSASS